MIELITRYETLLKSSVFNPYYNSVSEWRRSIEEKILELKQIVNKK